MYILVAQEQAEELTMVKRVKEIGPDAADESWTRDRGRVER